MKGPCTSILLILTLIFSLPSTAQLTVGLKAGAIRAWEDYGSVVLPENAETHLWGLSVSGLLYRSINDHLSVGIEPGYVQRGAACYPGWWNDGTDPIFVGDTRLYLNYLEAPLMVMGNLPVLKGRLALYGKAGFGFSYLAYAMREQFDINTEEVVSETRVRPGKDSNLRRWDHGFYGNLGVGFPLAGGTIFAESGYYLSFRDVDRFNSSQNRSINFNVGYMRALK